MAPTDRAYDVDWVFSKSSNVHVANHRSWFVTFQEFKSKVLPGGEVQGIGDVQLEVKNSSSRKGRKSHNTITLKDVLYVPSAVCNILGMPSQRDFRVIVGPSSGKLKDLHTDETLAILDHVKLLKLRLVGQTGYKTSLEKDCYYIIAQWSDAERARWNATKLALQAKRAAVAAPKPRTVVDEYSSQEKDWLKENFRSEFYFLRMYGLSIYDEEDRKEGRSIVRAFMKADEEAQEQEKNDADRNAILEDAENDSDSHYADHYFNEDQLDYIEFHYRHSGNFMMCYGLEPWDEEDCREAIDIVEELMAEYY